MKSKFTIIIILFRDRNGDFIERQGDLVSRKVPLRYSRYGDRSSMEVNLQIPLSDMQRSVTAENYLNHNYCCRFVKPWLYSDFLFQLCPKGWEQTRLLNILHGFTRQVKIQFLISMNEVTHF